eukprot:TRINITY_DN517_c0_g1_i2.p1 TRINITY_DN517_c0_g1~~TRINITY_DN517_c0_g1_i2.p1  ORF type:complete len:481 (-),score=174.29 TRINITY_DN517_c0_g1_i2:43-1485(-)
MSWHPYKGNNGSNTTPQTGGGYTPPAPAQQQPGQGGYQPPPQQNQAAGFIPGQNSYQNQQPYNPQQNYNQPQPYSSSGFPPQAQSGGYPPQQPGQYPQQGYNSYMNPQQSGGFPPQQPGGYPPQQPPQSGGYPAQQPGGYPPQQPGQQQFNQYNPNQPPYGQQQPTSGGFPPTQQSYNPYMNPQQSGGFPPQFQPQSGGYPPQQPGQYPQQQFNQYNQPPNQYNPYQSGGFPPQQPGQYPQQPGGYPQQFNPYNPTQPPAYITQQTVTRVTQTTPSPANNLSFFKHINLSMARDYVLIIDKSGSMAGSLWRQAHEAVSSLTPHVCRADPDGITIYFFSGGNHFPKYDNVKSPEIVEDLFRREKPGGTTNLAGVLAEAFRDHFRKGRVGWKPTTVLVITDGEPDDRGKVEKEIKEATWKMDRLEDLSVSFIQIGKDGSATRFLQKLDDDIKGAKFDIVDSLTVEEMNQISFVDLIKKSVYD